MQGKVDKLSALSRQYADFSAKKYKKDSKHQYECKKKSRQGGNQLLRLFLGTYILLPVFVIFVSKNTLTKPKYSLPLPE